jgi:hypothetical protein
MSDLIDNQAAQAVKLVGQDQTGLETYPARVTPNQDVAAVDTVNTSAVSSSIILNGTPQELKVGPSRLANRKYIWMQALGNTVKWGFGPNPTDCVFDCFKNQLFSFPIGNVPIYAYAATGTPNLAFGEGA